MAPKSLDIHDIAKGSIVVHLKITGVTRFRFLLILATTIMRLAVWIMPVPVVMEVENEART